MRRRGTPGKGRPHAAEATETAAPAATEASTAAPRPIAGTPDARLRGNTRGCDELISLNVRFQGQPGPHLLAVSFSQFDPDSDIGRIEIPQCSDLLLDHRVQCFRWEAQERASSAPLNSEQFRSAPRNCQPFCGRLSVRQTD